MYKPEQFPSDPSMYQPEQFPSDPSMYPPPQQFGTDPSMPPRPDAYPVETNGQQYANPSQTYPSPSQNMMYDDSFDRKRTQVIWLVEFWNTVKLLHADQIQG